MFKKFKQKLGRWLIDISEKRLGVKQLYRRAPFPPGNALLICPTHIKPIVLNVNKSVDVRSNIPYHYIKQLLAEEIVNMADFQMCLKINHQTQIREIHYYATLAVLPRQYFE